MWSSESYELTKWKSSEFRGYLFLFGPNDFDFNLDLITAAVMVDATASIPTYCKVNATISPSLAIQVDSGRGVERFGRSCRGVCNCPEQWRAYRGGCVVRCRRYLADLPRFSSNTRSTADTALKGTTTTKSFKANSGRPRLPETGSIVPPAMDSPSGVPPSTPNRRWSLSPVEMAF